MENKVIPASQAYVGTRAQRYDCEREGKQKTILDQSIVERFLAAFPAGSKILDVPAGTGRFIDFCHERNLIYYGVDISQDMLIEAQRKISRRNLYATHSLYRADARAMPFPNEMFDGAISVKFIKWLPSIELIEVFLREMKRVVHGEMMVQATIRLEKKRPTLFDKLRYKIRSKKEIKLEPRYCTQEELDKVFASVGLHVVNIVEREKKNTAQTCIRFYVLAK